MDNLCSSSGAVALRTRHIIYVWWVRAYLADLCSRRAGSATVSGTQIRLMGSGAAIEASNPIDLNEPALGESIGNWLQEKMS